MKKIISAAVLITGAFLAGCQKTPTNVGPTNEYASNSYPTSTDQLNSVLAAAYSEMRDPSMFGFELLPKAISNATHEADAGGYEAGDPSWQEMGSTSFTVANTHVANAWTAFYLGVKNCNATLDAATFFLANYAKPTDTATVRLIEGQAYCLRGYYYMWLETLFGEDNVPNPTGTDTMGVVIFTHLPTTLAQTQQARASIKTTWALIMSDLNTAAQKLNGQKWSGNDLGRVDSWTALGLLGKAQVYTKDYADAKTTLANVINNSGKLLMDYQTYQNSFIGIPSAKHNVESLFEINIDSVSNGDYGVYGNNPNSTSIMGLIWPPWALGSDGTEGSAFNLGYGNENVHERNIKRFGYNLGYYTLVDNPNFDNSQPPSQSNPARIMDPAYKTAALAARTNLTVDPRLWINTLQPWCDSIMPDGKTWYPVCRPTYAQGATQFGFSWRKYAPVFNNINNLGPSDVSDIYLLRLAEVYLLYAEACMNSGDNQDALTYINMVHRRAYGLPINQSSSVDYASLSSPTPAAVAGDPVLGNNPLYYENWAETWGEGQWWNDICRWHLGASEAAFFGYSSNDNGGNSALTFPDASYCWPIPLSELNTNPAIAGQQNPGYN